MIKWKGVDYRTWEEALEVKDRRIAELEVLLDAERESNHRLSATELRLRAALENSYCELCGVVRWMCQRRRG